MSSLYMIRLAKAFLVVTALVSAVLLSGQARAYEWECDVPADCGPVAEEWRCVQNRCSEKVVCQPDVNCTCGLDDGCGGICSNNCLLDEPQPQHRECGLGGGCRWVPGEGIDSCLQDSDCPEILPPIPDSVPVDACTACLDAGNTFQECRVECNVSTPGCDFSVCLNGCTNDLSACLPFCSPSVIAECRETTGCQQDANGGHCRAETGTIEDTFTANKITQLAIPFAGLQVFKSLIKNFAQSPIVPEPVKKIIDDVIGPVGIIESEPTYPTLPKSSEQPYLPSLPLCEGELNCGRYLPICTERGLRCPAVSDVEVVSPTNPAKSLAELNQLKLQAENRGSLFNPESRAQLIAKETDDLLNDLEILCSNSSKPILCQQAGSKNILAGKTLDFGKWVLDKPWAEQIAMASPACRSDLAAEVLLEDGKYYTCEGAPVYGKDGVVVKSASEGVNFGSPVLPQITSQLELAARQSAEEIATAVCQQTMLGGTSVGTLAECVASKITSLQNQIIVDLQTAKKNCSNNVGCEEKFNKEILTGKTFSRGPENKGQLVYQPDLIKSAFAGQPDGESTVVVNDDYYNRATGEVVALSAAQKAACTDPSGTLLPYPLCQQISNTAILTCASDDSNIGGCLDEQLKNIKSDILFVDQYCACQAGNTPSECAASGKGLSCKARTLDQISRGYKFQAGQLVITKEAIAHSCSLADKFGVAPIVTEPSNGKYYDCGGSYDELAPDKAKEIFGQWVNEKESIQEECRKLHPNNLAYCAGQKRVPIAMGDCQPPPGARPDYCENIANQIKAIGAKLDPLQTGPVSGYVTVFAGNELNKPGPVVVKPKIIDYVVYSDLVTLSDLYDTKTTFGTVLAMIDYCEKTNGFGQFKAFGGGTGVMGVIGDQYYRCVPDEPGKYLSLGDDANALMTSLKQYEKIEFQVAASGMKVGINPVVSGWYEPESNLVQYAGFQYTKPVNLNSKYKLEQDVAGDDGRLVVKSYSDAKARYCQETGGLGQFVALEGGYYRCNPSVTGQYTYTGETVESLGKAQSSQYISKSLLEQLSAAQSDYVYKKPDKADVVGGYSYLLKISSDPLAIFRSADSPLNQLPDCSANPQAAGCEQIIKNYISFLKEIGVEPTQTTTLAIKPEKRTALTLNRYDTAALAAYLSKQFEPTARFERFMTDPLKSLRTPLGGAEINYADTNVLEDLWGNLVVFAPPTIGASWLAERALGVGSGFVNIATNAIFGGMSAGNAVGGVINDIRRRDQLYAAMGLPCKISGGNFTCDNSAQEDALDNLIASETRAPYAGFDPAFYGVKLPDEGACVRNGGTYSGCYPGWKTFHDVKSAFIPFLYRHSSAGTYLQEADATVANAPLKLASSLVLDVVLSAPVLNTGAKGWKNKINYSLKPLSAAELRGVAPVAEAPIEKAFEVVLNNTVGLLLPGRFPAQSPAIDDAALKIRTDLAAKAWGQTFAPGLSTPKEQILNALNEGASGVYFRDGLNGPAVFVPAGERAHILQLLGRSGEGQMVAGVEYSWMAPVAADAAAKAAEAGGSVDISALFQSRGADVAAAIIPPVPEAVGPNIFQQAWQSAKDAVNNFINPPPGGGLSPQLSLVPAGVGGGPPLPKTAAPGAETMTRAARGGPGSAAPPLPAARAASIGYNSDPMVEKANDLIRAIEFDLKKRIEATGLNPRQQGLVVESRLRRVVTDMEANSRLTPDQARAILENISTRIAAAYPEARGLSATERSAAEAHLISLSPTGLDQAVIARMTPDQAKDLLLQGRIVWIENRVLGGNGADVVALMKLKPETWSPPEIVEWGLGSSVDDIILIAQKYAEDVSRNPWLGASSKGGRAFNTSEQGVITNDVTVGVSRGVLNRRGLGENIVSNEDLLLWTRSKLGVLPSTNRPQGVEGFTSQVVGADLEVRGMSADGRTKLVTMGPGEIYQSPSAEYVYWAAAREGSSTPLNQQVELAVSRLLRYNEPIPLSLLKSIQKADSPVMVGVENFKLVELLGDSSVETGVPLVVLGKQVALTEGSVIRNNYLGQVLPLDRRVITEIGILRDGRNRISNQGLPIFDRQEPIFSPPKKVAVLEPGDQVVFGVDANGKVVSYLEIHPETRIASRLPTASVPIAEVLPLTLPGQSRVDKAGSFVKTVLGYFRDTYGPGFGIISSLLVNKAGGDPAKANVLAKAVWNVSKVPGLGWVARGNEFNLAITALAWSQREVVSGALRHVIGTIPAEIISYLTISPTITIKVAGEVAGWVKAKAAHNTRANLDKAIERSYFEPEIGQRLLDGAEGLRVGFDFPAAVHMYNNEEALILALRQDGKQNPTTKDILSLNKIIGQQLVNYINGNLRTRPNQELLATVFSAQQIVDIPKIAASDLTKPIPPENLFVGGLGLVPATLKVQLRVPILGKIPIVGRFVSDRTGIYPIIIENADEMAELKTDVIYFLQRSLELQKSSSSVQPWVEAQSDAITTLTNQLPEAERRKLSISLENPRAVGLPDAMTLSRNKVAQAVDEFFQPIESGGRVVAFYPWNLIELQQTIEVRLARGQAIPKAADIIAYIRNLRTQENIYFTLKKGAAVFSK